MAFKITTAPTYNGISNISKINTKLPKILVEKNVGIPCIIVNGAICDLNGVPFANKAFQEEYAEIALRFMKCKIVAFAKICRSTGFHKEDDPYCFDRFSFLNSRSSRSIRNKLATKVIVEDIFSTISELLTFSCRIGMIDSIISGYKKDSKCNIECTKYASIDKPSFDAIENFILDCASRYSATEIKAPSSIYKESDKNGDFIIDPFELMQVKISSYKEIKFGEIKSELSFSAIRSIMINFNKKKIEISFISKKPSTCKYLRDEIISGNVDKIWINAIKKNNEIIAAIAL